MVAGGGHLEVVVRLERSATIRGRVVGAGRRTLAFHDSGRASTVTLDAAGAFDIAVSPGQHLLSLRDEASREGAARLVAVASGETALVDFVLEPVPLLHGRIRDPASGAPVPGAVLHILRDWDATVSSWWAWSTPADASGGFAAPVPPGSGAIRVYAQAPGTASYPIELASLPPWIEVDLVPGTPPGSLRVVVLTAEGLPLGNAAIAVECTSPVALRSEGRTSLPNGRSDFADLPEGTYRVQLQAWPVERAVDVRAGAETEVVLQLGREEGEGELACAPGPVSSGATRPSRGW